MSFAKVRKSNFVLFKREDSDLVRPRPFAGNHKVIVRSALAEAKEKSSDILMELAKI